ncbi:putative ribonuclease H-like domain-containing protein [Tanacetum coccineum]
MFVYRKDLDKLGMYCKPSRTPGKETIKIWDQPPGFEDPDYPDKVYKVVKALYGLHQAPRAWYETLAKYLLDNGFHRGRIDPTLFVKKQKGDILLVQVYVDDIIFGSTNKELCTGFEKLMKDKFQMSSMGELTFFLGLQVQQRKDGIFISQDKYVAEILRKFNYTNVKTASTPVDLERPLIKDGDAEDVDVHLYRSMIGSLMYLTSSRPDIMFVVCACARFQVTPKTSHLLAVKRIFRYLKGKPTLGLWYSRNSPFELVAYTDSDYAGATQDRKSTTGGSKYVAAASCYGQVLWIQNQLLDYGYNFMNTMIHIDNNSTICIIENPVQHSKTKHIEIRHHFIRDCNAKKLIQMVKIDIEHNVADLLTKGFDAGRLYVMIRRDLKLEDAENSTCLPNATIFEELARMGAKTTAWNEFSSTIASDIICLANNQKFNFSKYILDNLVKNLEGGVKFYMFPRRRQRKETKDHVPTSSNDPLPSGEDSSNINELMVQEQVLDLQKAKDAQAKDIANLKKTVKKLQRKRRSKPVGLRRLKKIGARKSKSSKVIDSLGDQEDSSKQGRRIEAIDADDEVTLEAQREEDDLMFDTSVLEEDEVVAEQVKEPEVVNTVSGPTTTTDELTLAQTLIEIAKSKKVEAITTAATSVTTTAKTRPKAKGIVFHEHEQTYRSTVSSTLPSSKDKGKSIMIEPERPLKRKE